MKTNRLSRRGAELLLALVIIARATSYLFSKLILDGMGMFNLLGVRFTLAFALLFLMLFKRLKSMSGKTFAAGAVMGGMFFLVMTAELSGLKRTATGNTAFLENTAIVLVPLLQAVLGRCLPKGKVILSALLCLTGVGVLALGGGVGFGAGECWCLLAAFLYACTILVTDRLSHSGIDTLAAGVVQVGVIGALSFAASFLTETPRLPSGTTEWLGIVMLAVVCTGFGFTLQPVAQSGTTAERAGMFCALNPVVAAILGVVFLHEPFTVKTILGGVLILFGILFAELPERQGKVNLKKSIAPSI
ncbi:MAG: DMT family transporter [Oscillospiraceae bacterium]|nr:DMT family transporter [Oscillospiraceae bacterium]